MTSRPEIVGHLADVISNDANLYEGDLSAYLKALFFNAKNLYHPFHNFRHMMHVTWETHNACAYYQKELSKRQMRSLLIAAMFHDYDHTGKSGDDRANIDVAILGLKRHAMPVDVPHLPEIIELIEATQYPYQALDLPLSLSAQILRDADISQALNSVWLQQVVFGLAKEAGVEPITILRHQSAFLQSIEFSTDWAKKRWKAHDIQRKIDETQKLLSLLE